MHFSIFKAVNTDQSTYLKSSSSKHFAHLTNYKRKHKSHRHRRLPIEKIFLLCSYTFKSRSVKTTKQTTPQISLQKRKVAVLYQPCQKILTARLHPPNQFSGDKVSVSILAHNLLTGYACIWNPLPSMALYCSFSSPPFIGRFIGLTKPKRETAFCGKKVKYMQLLLSKELLSILQMHTGPTRTWSRNSMNTHHQKHGKLEVHAEEHKHAISDVQCHSPSEAPHLLDSYHAASFGPHTHPAHRF